MDHIGFYQARTHLSELLDEVAKGRTLLITRRGKPAALLSPPPRQDEKDIKQVLAEMKALRRGNTLGGRLSIRALIVEGRRY
jgi:antitoxin (DNA-binding transcriptional repressor) of toxin-antitoxin stability system